MAAIIIGALRELLAQDLLGAFGEIRHIVEQPDEYSLANRVAEIFTRVDSDRSRRC